GDGGRLLTGIPGGRGLLSPGTEPPPARPPEMGDGALVGAYPGLQTPDARVQDLRALPHDLSDGAGPAQRVRGPGGAPRQTAIGGAVGWYPARTATECRPERSPRPVLADSDGASRTAPR